MELFVIILQIQLGQWSVFPALVNITTNFLVVPPVVDIVLLDLVLSRLQSYFSVCGKTGVGMK